VLRGWGGRRGCVEGVDTWIEIRDNGASARSQRAAQALRKTPGSGNLNLLRGSSLAPNEVPMHIDDAAAFIVDVLRKPRSMMVIQATNMTFGSPK